MMGSSSARSAEVTVVMLTRLTLTACAGPARVGRSRALGSERVSTATEKMLSEGLPQIAVDTFARYEKRLREGEQGVVRESEIEPLEELPDAAELPDPDPAVLDRVVVLKLNGG